MKKRFISKTYKKKKNFKKYFLIIIFLVIMFFIFRSLEASSIKITDKKLVEILLNRYKYESVTGKFSFMMPTKPTFYLQNNYTEEVEDKKNKDKDQDKDKEKDEEKNTLKKEEPLIYIYNSHQTEEYKASSFAEFGVGPTVMMVDYILQDIFNKNNYLTLVEEKSISEVLHSNNWKYAYSYRASRLFLEQAIIEHPSLTYFIDVHRDSLEHDRTYVSINGKDYAKTIFLIGLENENYQENLAFTEKINNKMNEKYPGLSKGIYQKGGALVNGVYNQDFSNRTILIEMGGYESTTTEVLNSAIAFAECFLEVINEG